MQEKFENMERYMEAKVEGIKTSYKEMLQQKDTEIQEKVEKIKKNKEIQATDKEIQEKEAAIQEKDEQLKNFRSLQDVIVDIFSAKNFKELAAKLGKDTIFEGSSQELVEKIQNLLKFQTALDIGELDEQGKETLLKIKERNARIMTLFDAKSEEDLTNRVIELDTLQENLKNQNIRKLCRAKGYEEFDKTKIGKNYAVAKEKFGLNDLPDKLSDFYEIFNIILSRIANPSENPGLSDDDLKFINTTPKWMALAGKMMDYYSKKATQQEKPRQQEPSYQSDFSRLFLDSDDQGSWQDIYQKANELKIEFAKKLGCEITWSDIKKKLSELIAENNQKLEANQILAQKITRSETQFKDLQAELEKKLELLNSIVDQVLKVFELPKEKRGTEQFVESIVSKEADEFEPLNIDRITKKLQKLNKRVPVVITDVALKMSQQSEEQVPEVFKPFKSILLQKDEQIMNLSKEFAESNKFNANFCKVIEFYLNLVREGKIEDVARLRQRILDEDKRRPDIAGKLLRDIYRKTSTIDKSMKVAKIKQIALHGSRRMGGGEISRLRARDAEHRALVRALCDAVGRLTGASPACEGQGARFLLDTLGASDLLR